MAGRRSLAVSLGLSALAAVPVAAQAPAAIRVSATVVDLRPAETNLQAASALLAHASVAPAATPAPVRRDTGTASILVSYPVNVPGASPDPLVATVIYW